MVGLRFLQSLGNLSSEEIRGVEEKEKNLSRLSGGIEEGAAGGGGGGCAPQFKGTQGVLDLTACFRSGGSPPGSLPLDASRLLPASPPPAAELVIQ